MFLLKKNLILYTLHVCQDISETHFIFAFKSSVLTHFYCLLKCSIVKYIFTLRDETEMITCRLIYGYHNLCDVMIMHFSTLVCYMVKSTFQDLVLMCYDCVITEYFYVLVTFAVSKNLNGLCWHDVLTMSYHYLLWCVKTLHFITLVETLVKNNYSISKFDNNHTTHNFSPHHTYMKRKYCKMYVPKILYSSIHVLRSDLP